eukprot:TRINITY_DN8315_c0_g1_i1.p1 TRINITY_DN8315_c0_g1~~TRINITY_DN8315_c0_g1_i1.p1  ORF type:complete len:341 (-),score=100.27 TRINITY_DN8315_c0_g1_i1:275-1297(-)
MGERKVINKYYPPDFDPLNVPKGKRPVNGQMKIRMMLPMSVQCNTCGEYMYRGKKFNSRKEIVEGEEYLGIKIHRFYLKCTRCSAEFSIKTDPKNADYVAEFGASRNFEPWRENRKAIEEAEAQKEREELGDAMKALENRTVDNKLEIAILDALDEIRSMNARTAKITPDDLVTIRANLEKMRMLVEEEEDEAEIREAFGLKKEEGEEESLSGNLSVTTTPGTTPIIIRKIEDTNDDYLFPPNNKLRKADTETNETKPLTPTQTSPSTNKQITQTLTNNTMKVQPKVQVTPKVQITPKIQIAPKKEITTQNNNNSNNSNTVKKEEPVGLLGILDYSDDES